MKIYLKEQNDRERPYYLRRDNSFVWNLMCEEPRGSDWKVRELDEYETNFVESVFQHFVEPMKKLTGE